MSDIQYIQCMIYNFKRRIRNTETRVFRSRFAPLLPVSDKTHPCLGAVTYIHYAVYRSGQTVDR